MANELRIRQIGIGGLVEDNPLTSGATTLTSASLAAVSGGVGSTQHLPIVLDPDGVSGTPEIAYVTALTGGAGSGTILRAQEGTTARQHAKDTPWVHAPTLRDVVRHVSARRESTDLTVTQTARTAALDTALDLVLPAQAGDIIEIAPAFMVANNNATNADVFMVDVATIVSAAVVNWVSGSGSTTGVPAWNRFATSSQVRVGVSGAVPYTVVAGDISAGTVKLSLYAFLTGGSYNVYARTVAPFVWMAKNLGPATA